MASDEDNYGCEVTFSKSPIGILIARISKMLRNPVIDMDLNETLDSFLDQLNESQEYLSHGIFNVKFAEAGLFLQNAVTLYGKKVDSLWDSTLQYQMQLCSHTKPSEGSVDETTVITQRLNRNKRKKLVVQDADASSSLYEDLSTLCDKANDFLKRRCSSMQHHAEASQNNILSNDYSSESALNAVAASDGRKSISGYRFPIDFPVNNIQSGEKLCNYSDLYLNCAVPFLETSKQVAENFDGSECSMTNRINDLLLQQYVIERHLTYKKFWARLLGDDFAVFMQTHQQEVCNGEANIRSSLDERARSLCPKAFVVNLSRLPDELMAEYVKSNNVHVKELIQGLLTREKDTELTANPNASGIKKCSERISDGDSLFHDGQFDDTEDAETLPEPCDNILLTQRSGADSGICVSEGHALSIVNESGVDMIPSEDLVNNDCEDADIAMSLELEQQNVIEGIGADTFVDVTSEEMVENIGRNEYVVDSLDRLGNGDENIAIGIKNLAQEKIPAIPAQISVVHRSNLKPMKDTKNEQNLKRKLLQNSDNKLEKRRKVQTRFRWLKTTTTTLTSFEKFFKHNYQPEFGEGDIPEDDVIDEPSGVIGLEHSEVENEITATTNLDALPPTTVVATTETHLDDVANVELLEDLASNASTVDVNDFPLGCENSEGVLTDNVTAQTISQEMIASNLQEATDAVSNGEVINVSTVSEARVKNSETESIERLRAVTEWKKFIEPKLKVAEQSCKFDIHDYGTRIMDAIPMEKNLNFNDLADGKQPSEVARLFLASLQLANTYNVELVNSGKGGLANDNLELKLLSRERYHEHLDEYEAPSENSFREKLAFIQALKPSLPLHSTPFKSRSGKCKRRKFSEVQ